MTIKEVVVQEGIAAIVPSPATPVLSSQPGPSCADSIQLEAQPPPARRKNLGTLFKEHEEEPQLVTTVNSVSLSPEQKCKKEIERYLIIKKLDFEDDPLYLCVCATSAPSEQVLSCSGNIVTPHCASMNADWIGIGIGLTFFMIFWYDPSKHEIHNSRYLVILL